MNILEAKSEARYLAKAGQPILFISPSGIGKSSVIMELFEEFKREGEAKGETWGHCIIFAATQTPPDAIGLQWKGERTYNGKTITITDPSAPIWFISLPHGDDPGGKPAWMYDKFFLFIDELGQGEPETKRTYAEIMRNGGLPHFRMPPGSVRIAATNEGARYGVTKDFDFFVSRRSQLRVEGDIVPFVQYLDKPYRFQGRTWLTPPVVKWWAQRHPDIVFEKEPKEQGPWCNPRTTCDAGRYLQVKAEDNDGKIPTDPLTIEALAGTIGMGATQSLIGDIQFRLELPQIEDVVKYPDSTPVPDKADLKMLMAYELAHEVTADTLTPVVAYMSRPTTHEHGGFPKDMAITFVKALLGRDWATFVNAPAMQAWITKNSTLVTLISTLSKGR